MSPPSDPDDPFAGPPLDDPDDAYANAAHIADADDYLARWPVEAAAFRATRAEMRTIPYGAHERERLEVYAPAGEPRGVAVIVHGGYWMRFEPAIFSHLAAGALARGWHVALPGYRLCPDTTLADIERGLCRAMVLAATLAPGPLRLAGHSAGGQLVMRSVCTDSALEANVAARIDRVLSISGVHDLVPLRATAMREPLGLTPSVARAASPARGSPRPGVHALAWVGGAERPEFVRQAGLLASAWGDAATLHVEPARHHFDVIDDLRRADSTMLQAWLGAPAPASSGSRSRAPRR